MIVTRQFTLEEDVSGKDLNFHVPLHLHLRRGIKIGMNMVFDRQHKSIGACPRCENVMDPKKSGTILW